MLIAKSPTVSTVKGGTFLFKLVLRFFRRLNRAACRVHLRKKVPRFLEESEGDYAV